MFNFFKTKKTKVCKWAWKFHCNWKIFCSLNCNNNEVTR